ncbi:ABC transporter ATP-binding protein [Brevibacillus agri]|uniref:ABC transporter ATP-binding protein n=1 Tax=Brevibacillus agri TaxID=51101 RepID=UPI002867F1A0|nr:ABC transporter ATP-binding protein [Brevibacillus agri]MED1644205.1 ABC transporter ATP-binding protein [Brevibacillus agri]MED1655473.1 ABC transporter ATP-binding protein [Brevibacillus agri]MED1687387.1 ABC transporter ATP-binding protein [Brevibacillus agri]MED1692046.1 ABC transporter ATP-binding protein [Brevibacillus agri]MED1697962.1 ABC transporter ATP-binding protein [Brevibacillus agri]
MSQEQKEQPFFPPRPGRGFGHGGARVPVSKPKNFSATIKRLWQAFGREKRWLPLVFAIVLVDGLLMLSAPYLIGKAIDAMTGGAEAFSFLSIIILALLGSYIVDGALTFLQGWMIAGITQRIVTNMRQALFEKLQKLPIAFFDSRTHGELMSRLTNDIDNVSNSISQSTTQLMSGVIVLAGSLVMMLVLSPILTLACLITVPLVFLLTRTIAKRTSVLFKNQQIELGKLNGHIEETISGIQVVKAFNHEEKAIADFAAINDRLCKVGMKAQIWSGFLMPIMNVINNLGFAMVAIVGGILAVKGMITVGVIASFLSYSRQFVRPLNDLANIFNVLQSGVAGAERVFEVLDEREEPLDSPDAAVLREPKGHVVFDRVSFGYRPDQPILKNVSFEAQAGSTTALVGPTGAGKTTVVNLLTRFYDVTEGTIYLDGKDIREYSRDSLRRSFGFVLQDTYLFSGTIKENIMYGKPDATDAEVEAAAKMAHADVFINRLPKRYDTQLTENGGNLSQGQRQLLAIARVILARPSLLILDEATSSIDTRTELIIQDTLATIMEGRTSFVIAHRLGTIRDADAIMVVDSGEIVEKGSHDDLIAQKGVYYQLFYNQFKNLHVASS